MTKKVVSSFEFAIAQLSDPEAAKFMRPETRDERSIRRARKISDLARTLKIQLNDKGKNCNV